MFSKKNHRPSTESNMSDEEFDEFLAAIPIDHVAPFGDGDEGLFNQGVTKEDIRMWNALGTERQDKIKEGTKIGELKILMTLSESNGLSSGMSPQDAMIKILKESRTFDDYPYPRQVKMQLEELGFTSEDDYPLPWELHRRVKDYDQLLLNDSKRWMEIQSLVEHPTSGNAFLRELTRKGVI